MAYLAEIIIFFPPAYGKDKRSNVSETSETNLAR